MFAWQQEIKNGLLLLVTKNRSYIETTSNKLQKMHTAYVDRNSHLYNTRELHWINYYLRSIIYKFFLVSISVEQLQSVRHGKIHESLWTAIENSLERLDCSDDEQLLVSFALETFLFEGRAFLDVYMLYVCLLLRTGFTNGQMNKTRFYDELNRATQTSFSRKATWVTHHFDTKVFGEEKDDATIFRNDWGTLLQNLRDRIAHRDKINISLESKEVFVNDILLDWPTIKGITYHSLAETIRNGMHSLFYEVSAHIYDSNWDDF